MALEFLNQLFADKNSTIFLLVGLTILIFILFTPKIGGGGHEKYYYRAKRLRRKEIEQYLSSLEKRILELDRRITSMKIKEQDLEIKFAAKRDISTQREVQNMRKALTELANKRDRLLEEKQAYAKAYREVTL